MYKKAIYNLFLTINIAEIKPAFNFPRHKFQPKDKDKGK